MHQYEQLGGGVAKDELYLTYEIKQCPVCKRLVKETYQCEVISQAKVDKLLAEKDPEIVPIDHE